MPGAPIDPDAPKGMYRYATESKTIIPTVTSNVASKAIAGSSTVQSIVNGGMQGGMWQYGGPVAKWRPNCVAEQGLPAGHAGSSRWLPASSGNLGCIIQYDYGEPVSIGCFRYNSSTYFPFGSWQLQGSQTGTNWTNIGKPFPFIGYPGLGNVGDTKQFMQVPYDANAWGGGYLINPDAPYESAPRINSLFYRMFRLIGVSGDHSIFPVDGGLASLPEYRVYCADFTGAELSGQAPGTLPGQADVWTGPKSPTFLGPDDGTDLGGIGGSDPTGGGDTPGGTPTDPVPPLPPPPPPPNSYFHPYSRGLRGFIYDATTNPGGNGNGVLATFPIMHDVYGDAPSGIDWNFGAAAGNGPYVGSYIDGFNFLIQFPTKVMMTGILLVEPGDASNTSIGQWKLQAYDDASATWIDISDTKVMQYGINSQLNSIYGNSCELLANVFVFGTQFRLIKVTSDGTAGRICNDMLFKLAIPELMGGDRRQSVPNQKNRVTVTTNFSMHDDDGAITDFGGLVDGQIGTFNGGLDGGGVTTVSSPNGPPLPYGRGGMNAQRFIFQHDDDRVGKYFQFTFGRGVILSHISPNIAGNQAEEIVSGSPTKFGLWKMQFADAAGGPYTDCAGGPFVFKDRQYKPVIDIGNSDVNPHSYWRLTQVAGGTWADNLELHEFEFMGVDQGEATSIPIQMQDDDGMSIQPPVISEPSDPFKIALKDEDGMVIAVPNIKVNYHLSASFIDEGLFDVFTYLSPRPLPQVNVYQRGRK